MPTNPTTPKAGPAIDRLTLDVTSARVSGTEPSFPAPGMCACFEAETSSACIFISCSCFEAESSAVIFGCFGSSCFETE